MHEKKIKIAMFGHKRVPSREGGVEVVVEMLSTRMAKLGHDVTLYNRSGHHVSGSEYDSHIIHKYGKVKIKTVPTINVKGVAALISSVISSFLTAFGNYDIVHIHAEGPAVMCWLPKIFGKKVVVTIHGLNWKTPKWGKLAKSIIMLGEKNAVKYADEIIVLSKQMESYFLEKYNRKTTYIPNGIDAPTKIECNQIYKRWGLTKNSYVLFLGRIVPDKGIEYLIEAWKKIDTNKKLVIAGGNSDSIEYYNWIKSTATNDCIFTDFVQGELLGELFSNAYVYVFPSNNEGMPLSLLEAMSFGNCCLVSDIPECMEVIEKQAVSFKKGNVEDLGRKLQFLLDNKSVVEKYKDEASLFILNKYKWDDIVERTVELYRKK